MAFAQVLRQCGHIGVAGGRLKCWGDVSEEGNSFERLRVETGFAMTAASRRLSA
jgi:hypothetical protein